METTIYKTTEHGERRIGVRIHEQYRGFDIERSASCLDTFFNMQKGLLTRMVEGDIRKEKKEIDKLLDK